MKGLTLRRSVSLACAAALLSVTGTGIAAAPVQAATEQAWQVTAFFSKPAWKATAPKAAILKACKTGTGGSPFAIGTPLTVMDMNDAVLGSGTVTKVKLWKEGGRFICKYIGTVPVAANSESLFQIRVGSSPPHLYSRGDMRAEKWTASFWPRP
jgi:hypothetical protein